MAERGPDAATAETGSTPPSGGSFKAEDYVTPELQAKFDEVFGGKSSAPATPAKAGEGRPNAGPTAKTRQREAEAAEELEDLEDDGDDEPITPRSKKPSAARDESDADDEDGSDEADGESAEDESAEDAGEESPASTLPAVLRQAAKRAGWSDAEIAEFAQANPEMAEKTFQRLHSTQNDLTARYARLGQQAHQDGNGQQPPAGRQGSGRQNASQNTGGGDLLTELYGDQMEALTAKYGEDFVDEVLKPLTGPLEQAMTFVREQQQAVLMAEVDAFWKSQAGEFSDLYGDAGKTPTAQQMDARDNVALLADQIRSGAASQGIQMTVSEALERAHLVASAERLQELERKRLTSKVKKRSAQITARPTQRQRMAASTGKKSEQAAIEAYQQRAAELGLDL
jgi:hypothetical protein